MTTAGWRRWASVGWGFGNGSAGRARGQLRLQPLPRCTASGDSASVATTRNNYGVFVNGLYDFNVGWPVTPYVGAGVGYEWTGLRGGHVSVAGTDIIAD